MLTRTATAPAPAWVTVRSARRTGVLTGLGAALVVAMLASLVVGAKSIPIGDVVSAFGDYDRTNTNHLMVRELRLPRTIVGVLVGAALGVGGAVMQGVTRNPLADPGVLGVNAGASFAVVLAIWAFDVLERARATSGSRSSAPRWCRWSCTPSARSGGAAPRRCGWHWPAPRSARCCSP